jgi:glucoamylase
MRLYTFRLVIISSLFQLSLATHSSAREIIKQETNPLQKTFELSLKNLFQNLNHSQIKKGAVIASPSQVAPNYFFHWTRDAGLTHHALFKVYAQTKDPSLKKKIKQKAFDWIEFETEAQKNAENAVASLGEPRFHLEDAKVNTDPWGRPQNDGPAARAISLSLWALSLLDEQERSFVEEKIYRAEFPSNTLLKKDLEYVSKHWKEPCFDLWEEVKGLHFFTLALQRRALLLGSKVATKMNDPQAADWYRNQALEIKKVLISFISPLNNFVGATLAQTEGWSHKKSNLDIAVIIASNHAFFGSTFFESYFIEEDEIIKDYEKEFIGTLESLEQKFIELYPLNKEKSELAPALGRYPEDVYDGNGFSGGNPWFISTHAAAEFYCEYSKKLKKSNAPLSMQEEFHAKGLKYLERSPRHINQENGEMSEQFSRFNGYLIGASHLTWSYASFISAYLSCAEK